MPRVAHTPTLKEEWNNLINAPSDLAKFTVKKTKDWSQWVTASDKKTGLDGYQRFVYWLASNAGLSVRPMSGAEKVWTIAKRASISLGVIVGVATATAMAGKGIEILATKIIDSTQRPCVIVGQNSLGQNLCKMGNPSPDVETVVITEEQFASRKKMEKTLGYAIQLMGNVIKNTGEIGVASATRPIYWTSYSLPKWTLNHALPAIYSTLASFPAPESVKESFGYAVQMITGSR